MLIRATALSRWTAVIPDPRQLPRAFLGDAQVAEVEVPLNEMCVRTLRGLCQIKQRLSPNNAESDGVDDDTSAGTTSHNIPGKSESGAG